MLVIEDERVLHCTLLFPLGLLNYRDAFIDSQLLGQRYGWFRESNDLLRPAAIIIIVVVAGPCCGGC